MRYFLGIAYATAGTLDKAIAYLQASIDADVEHEDARFQLASALDRAGQYAKARVEYDRFATAHPQSQFAIFATRRSATLARMPANPPQAPGDAKPPAVTPPNPKLAPPPVHKQPAVVPKAPPPKAPVVAPPVVTPPVEDKPAPPPISPDHEPTP
jgi:hypothetical protein